MAPGTSCIGCYSSMAGDRRRRGRKLHENPIEIRIRIESTPWKRFLRFRNVDIFTFKTGAYSYGYFHECERCKSSLNHSYVLLIRELKKAGLIPNDYPLLCCFCYKKKGKKVVRRVRKRLEQENRREEKEKKEAEKQIW